MGIAKIESPWFGDRSSSSWRRIFAVVPSGAWRRISMTASIWLRANNKPSTMCWRWLVCSSSWVYCLLKVCSRNLRNSSRIPRKGNWTGLLSTNDSIIAPKFVCRAVWRYSWCKTFFAVASFFSSITTRIPLRSLSSLRSEIPSILPWFTNSAVFSIHPALFTW